MPQRYVRHRISLAIAQANTTGAFSMSEKIPAHAHVGAASIIARGERSELQAKVHIGIH